MKQNSAYTARGPPMKSKQRTKNWGTHIYEIIARGYSAYSPFFGLSIYGVFPSHSSCHAPAYEHWDNE